MALPHGISCFFFGGRICTLEAAHIEFLPQLELHTREVIPHAQRTVLYTLYDKAIVAQVAYLAKAVRLPPDKHAMPLSGVYLLVLP